MDAPLYSGHSGDVYLVYSFLKENAWRPVQEDQHDGRVAAETQTSEQFFLKHIDDVGHHLLVDDNLKITDIIGW